MTVSLRELQENFLEYVIKDNRNILEAVCTLQADAIERINIYKAGYSLRLLEVLEKDFPILRKIIGEELFKKMGREYINLYPSHHYNICLFSQFYSSFLNEAKYEPYWSEIVAFEWALSCSLDAADAPQIGMDELSTVTGEAWPYIQFTLHPSVSFHKYHYNAPQITYAYMVEEPVPELVFHETPVDFLVWRFNLQSYFEALTKEKLWILNSINQGKTFAEICEGLCEWLPEEEVPMFAAGSLRHWLDKGIFSGFSTAQMPITDAVEETIA